MAITSLADLYKAEDSEMLRAPVVARILDIPKQKLYTLTRANAIAHVRIGQSVRYPSHKVLEYIESRGAAYEPGSYEQSQQARK